MCDSWRTVIGSTGLSIINAFFDAESNEGKFDSDDEWQAFTRDMLDEFKFLYSNIEDPEVCSYCRLLINKYSIYYGCYCQRMRGLFCGPFILWTFAAHFNAIRGTIKIRSLGDPKSVDKLPYGALALAVISVCYHIFIS
jgi:hypothetical protein